jgi:hypothetical protein
LLITPAASGPEKQKKGTTMNRTTRTIPTEFGPEARFAVWPRAAGPPRAVQEAEFQLLKSRMLEEQLESAWEIGHQSRVRQAANEAAALSWLTPYPLLVFPVLFEEKVAVAAQRARKQAEVRQRSLGLLAL